LVIIAQVQDPSPKVRAQDPPYIGREAHALESLVDHLPRHGVEGVPDIEANGHGIAASVTCVPEVLVKRAQRVVGTPILPETELPVGQSDPRIGHEPLHPVYQQRLENLPNVIQETQRPVRRGNAFGFPGFAEKRETSSLPASRENPAPQTRVESGIKRQWTDVVHNAPDPTGDTVGTGGPVTQPQPPHRHLHLRV